MIDVGLIMDYEEGALDAHEVVELFSALVQSGQAWTLQGHYGRQAAALIENGILHEDGEVDWDVFDALV